MNSNFLIDAIRSLGTLTPSEGKLADFFSENYSELVFENVTSISQKTEVSKATVVRFIAKLGFSGFTDFHDRLREDLMFQMESHGRRSDLVKQRLSDKGPDIFSQCFSPIIKNLQYVHDHMDPERFMQASRLIAQAEGRLYITGQRSSFALARLFHILLIKLRGETILLGNDSTTLPDQLIDVDGNDLLFVIFRYPYAKLTLRVAKHFAAQGAKIILLTDSEFSPLIDLAHVHLVVSSKGLSLLHSSTAATAVLESLVTAALRFSDESIYERIAKAEKLFSEFDIFSPGKTLNTTRIKEFRKKETSSKK